MTPPSPSKPPGAAQNVSTCRRETRLGRCCAVLWYAVQLDEEEIKSAYRRLAMQYHPDRHITSDAAARAAAEKRFAALLKAYDTLKDPEQRALYNAGTTDTTFRKAHSAAEAP